MVYSRLYDFRPGITYKFLKASIHHLGISYVLVEALCQIESFSLGLGFIV